MVHSSLCVQVRNSSSSLWNSPDKALYAGEKSVAIRCSIPEILQGYTYIYTHSKHINIKPQRKANNAVSTLRSTKELAMQFVQLARQSSFRW